ncbi:unnamed protein product [Linum trigynum]|uniref:Uncharacterized protein n=1 Tax=Linum trigynum TaxID=586398 RepID=A0AAV2D9M6_9ROSI
MNNYLTMLDADQRKTLKDSRRPKVVQHHYLDWRVFEELGAREAMEAAIRAYSWRRLLCLAEPIYQELLWEFSLPSSISGPTRARTATPSSSDSEGSFTPLAMMTLVWHWGSFHLSPVTWKSKSPTVPSFGTSSSSRGSASRSSQALFSHRATPRPLSCAQSGASSTSYWGSLTPPSEGSTSHLQLRTLHCLHSMSQEVDNLHLSSLIARTVVKASRCGRPLACGPVVTALARYYNIDLSRFTIIQPAKPFSRDTLRRQLILQRDGDVIWIRGLPRPVPRAPEGEDLPEASDAAARQTTHRRRNTPSAPGTSTFAAGPSAAAPTTYIAEQLAAISRQNEQILAGQEHFNARLDREREGRRRIISAQHYMMSYRDMDPAAVSYPWEESPGHEDYYPPPAGDGGDEH